MITLKERNGLTINNSDEGEKTLFVDIDGKLKTKNENGLIEEVAIVSTSAPKVYKALLSQSGTDAPVATVLENTLGETVIWSRLGQGTFEASISNNLFFENKTLIFTSHSERLGDELVFMCNIISASTIECRNYTQKPTPQDTFISVSISIEVYP